MILSKLVEYGKKMEIVINNGYEYKIISMLISRLVKESVSRNVTIKVFAIYVFDRVEREGIYDMIAEIKEFDGIDKFLDF